MEPGSPALVIGAGRIGLIVASVARMLGAEVVLSEISDPRIVQARGLGFEVIGGRAEPALTLKPHRPREPSTRGLDEPFAVGRVMGS